MVEKKAPETKTDWQGMMKKLDAVFHEWFAVKAPAMPDDIKELIVKYGPWVSLVLGLLMLPVIFGALGLMSLFSPFAMWGGVGGFGVTMLLSGLTLLVTMVLMFVSIPKLIRREMGGWKLSYYSVLVGAVSNLVSLNISGLILGGVLSLYILYQVKGKYK